MQAWTLDAAKILDSSSGTDLTLAEVIVTNRIRWFLNHDKINFVVAPKGFGKTLLLIAKRLQYHASSAQGFQLIPGRGLLVDVPIGGAANLDWGKVDIKFFSDRRNWEVIWRACISLSIVQTLACHGEGSDGSRLLESIRQRRSDSDEPAFPILTQLVTEPAPETPLEYLNYILSGLHRRELRQLLREQQHLDRQITTVHTPIAIFIDNVDEYFEEHLEKGRGSYSPALRGIFDVNMWYLAQQSLIFAIRTMTRSNRHLDIFATIRKEAYAGLRGTTLENLRGSCLDDLTYSKAKLQEIFELNVRKTDREFLCEPESLSVSPVRALCGFDSVTNSVLGCDEPLFDYIYRHTLKRPRDVVRVGLGILQLDSEERTPDRIKDEIHKAATDIALDYIQLSLPHTGFRDQDQLLSFLQMIPHNILVYDTLHTICSDFNESCGQMSCDTCDRVHPFCDLYKLGLLGIIGLDVTRNELRQEFLAPGELTFAEKGVLPTNLSSERCFYLIHPILYELIGGSQATRINHSVLVGDRHAWTPPTLPSYRPAYRMFLSYAREDSEFADQLIEDLRAEGIPVWRDRENIEIGASFPERIAEGIAECAYFGVVISDRAIDSGWVAEEIRLAKKHEIERMQVKILPILREDLTKELPRELLHRQHADFRDDYLDALEALRRRLIEPEEDAEVCSESPSHDDA